MSNDNDHCYDTNVDTMQSSSSTIQIEPERELVELMREQWELPVPELIISVTGGAKLFKLTPPRVRRAFQEGLVSAAVNTGTRRKEKLYLTLS
jgi:hypothetical protein